MKKLMIIVFVLISYMAFGQTPKPPYTSSKFEQLGQELPTPNTYRTGSGEPGPDYWQQQADYKIKITLDDEKQSLKGSETITYYNNSPSDIKYLWVQLDQNRFKDDAEGFNSSNIDMSQPISFYHFSGILASMVADGGYKISNVRDAKGKALKYTINKTMMRIELPTVLKAKGGKFTFSLDYSFNIVDAAGALHSRGGYEYFAEDGNYVYEIAQWFPRMCVYDDVNGWQNKQFLGRGEFALPFGDYEVEITVPSDHIVAATGELQNAKSVLSSTHQSRLAKAEKSSEPIEIVTQDEAEKAEKSKAKGTKTWIYKAQNVRDFAWASSRKFIWDAMKVKIGNKSVWAMSYYPKEGNPLWKNVSTKSVAHTLKVYSKHTIDYPYPVAISVHGAVGGMEYPMISFNNQGRPDKEGNYSKQVEFSTISVIIHEVGHNFFPMIINSDERQWSWMDEGINTFVQYLAEKEWDKNFPFYAGPAKAIVPYMKGDPKALVPIMTNSEAINLMQFGPNAYAKPATALNILRDVVMGPELFDYAFKEYSKRWAFKHPKPADFFRSLEDASAIDLDWFWKGWFYGTEAVDVNINTAKLYKMPGQNLELSKDHPFKTVDYNAGVYGYMTSQMGKDKDKILDNAKGKYFYAIEFENKGGLFTPLLIKVNYKDGSSEMIKVPAEIWRLNPQKASKIIPTTKEVKSFELDPEQLTADINTADNKFPRKEEKSELEEFKKKKESASEGK